MAKTDSVPVFYRDQDDLRDRPVHVWLRGKCREEKNLSGKFENHGKTFRLFATKPQIFYDGPMGSGNLIPFTRVPNRLLKPEPLHYPIPCCGAHTRFLSVLKTNFVPEAIEA